MIEEVFTAGVHCFKKEVTYFQESLQNGTSCHRPVSGPRIFRFKHLIFFAD